MLTLQQVRGKAILANANLNGLHTDSDGEWLTCVAYSSLHARA